MRRANLRGANLHAADLMNTDLRGADLRGANLRAADFWNADLRDAKIAGAQYDVQTRWPGDFDPTNHGAISVRATSETSPSLVAVDVLFLGALIFVIVGFVVWLTLLLQLLRRIDTDETRMRIFGCCTLFGLAYGAAFGSLCGPGLWLPTGSGTFSAIIGGVIDGALLGAFGGGVAGFIGNLIGWRIGWTLPGVFGSATAAACMWSVTCIAAGWEPNQVFRQRNLVNGALWCSAAILIGSLLGMALDRALHRGQSFVPGVRWLAAIIGVRAQPPQESARAGTEESRW